MVFSNAAKIQLIYEAAKSSNADFSTLFIKKRSCTTFSQQKQTDFKNISIYLRHHRNEKHKIKLTMADVNNLYRLDGRVPIAKAIPFGLQHVLAMFVSNIAPIIILANIVGTDASISAALIQNCMIIAGIGTLVQLYPIWRIGSRLPIVMGISFTFLSLSIVIATSQGMGSLMGAVVIGGIVEGLLGIFAKFWIRIITPIVAATVVTAIGFSLLPIGANSFAGGLGAADFGAAHNWIVGSVTKRPVRL